MKFISIVNLRNEYTSIDEGDEEKEINVKALQSQHSINSLFIACFGFVVLTAAISTFFWILQETSTFPLLAGSSFLSTKAFIGSKNSIPVSKLWGQLKRPYPTNAFWTNFVVADGNGPVQVISN